MSKDNVVAYTEFADFLHHERISKMVKRINFFGDEEVLDIGCGDGKITAEIASIYVPNGRVLGIDNSNSMLDFAKIKFSHIIYHNLDFAYSNAQDFNFDCQFDLIVSFACLHSIRDHIPILLNIYKSLKNNGKIVLGFRGRDKFSTTIEHLIGSNKWKSRLGNNVEYNFCEKEMYGKFLAESGFIPEKVDISKRIVTYQGKADFTRGIRDEWFSLSNRIPIDLYEEFINELIETYLQVNPPDHKGMIHLHKAWLEIVATKSLKFSTFERDYLRGVVI